MFRASSLLSSSFLLSSSSLGFVQRQNSFGQLFFRVWFLFLLLWFLSCGVPSSFISCEFGRSSNRLINFLFYFLNRQ